MSFRFLDLAAELRNRVYYFASSSAVDRPVRITRTERTHMDNSSGRDSSDIKPYAALTRVCRQIRQEYLGIHRDEGRVVVAWSELTEYIDTFLGDKSHHTLAPRNLYIGIHPMQSSLPDSCPVVNLLPLVYQCAISSEMTIRFVESGMAGVDRDCEDIAGQCSSLNYLIGHQNAKWLETIRTGKLEAIDVHREGPRHGKIRLTFGKTQKPSKIRRQLDAYLRSPAKDCVIGNLDGEGRFWNEAFHHIVVGIAGKPRVHLTKEDILSTRN